MSEAPTLSFDQVIQMLGYVLSGDNTKIQQATKVLKIYTKRVESIATFGNILSQNENTSLRQLSAVLLRRNMAANFGKLDAASQSQFQQLLLQRFFGEEVNVIRTNIGQLIGTIAQQTLCENKWPELYQILQTQTAKTQDLVTRQRGLILLSLIFDYSGDSLKPFYSAFYPFFVENLQDTDKQIRVQTVKCLISLFDNIEHMEKSEAQQYKTLVEPILRFVDMSIREGDEDNAYHCFDAFGYLAESKLTILDSHLGMIIEYAAGPNILLNPSCSSKFKECVIDFIYSVLESHKKVMNNQVLLKQLVECLSLVVALPYSEDQLQSDEDPIQDVTLWLIETLTLSIGKKKPIYAIFLQVITQLVDSQDLNKMNAAYLILASITEGLQDLVRRNLQNPIMNVLIPKGLNDPRIEVRGAAIKCLSYFSEWLYPEILKYEKIILPEMVKSLSSTSNKVYEKALLTIDIFAENMEGDAIQPYLQTLLPNLVQMFLQPNTTFMARRICLSSIGSIVTSAKEHFTMYLKDVSDLLLKVIAEKDTPEILSIKAEAIQVIGKICEAFKDNVEVQTQLINPLSPQIYQMLVGNSDNEVREACLAFFYNMASAQGEAFAPVFAQIIDFTIQLAKSTDGLSYDKVKGNEFSLDSDSDSEGGDTQGPTRVKVTQMDEKAAAIHSLGQFAISVPMAFGNYFKTVFDILDETIEFFYENIRIQSLQCYRDLIEGYVKFKNNGPLPIYQKGLPCIESYDPEFAQFLQLDVLQKFIKIIVEDDSVECVALAIDVITDLLKKVGPQIIHRNIEDITRVILLVLQKKIKALGAEEDEDNDEDDMNETIFENLTDLIPTLSKVLKNGFLLALRHLLPEMFKYLSAEKDINEIIQMVGAFAQLFENDPSTIYETQNVVISFLLQQAIPIGDVELNRNTAFALATYCEFAQEADVLKILPQILQTIKVIFDNAGTYKEAAENATAAICRILIRFPQAVPLQNALETIIPQLPFTGDVQENFTAIRFLLFIANNYADLITPKMEIFIRLLLDTASQKEAYNINDENFAIVINALKQLLNTQYKQIIEQLILSCDENRKNKLIKLLQ